MPTAGRMLSSRRDCWPPLEGGFRRFGVEWPVPPARRAHRTLGSSIPSRPTGTAPAPSTANDRRPGCSGAIAAGSRTTAFLLDDDVLIDAGTGVGDLRSRRWRASTTSSSAIRTSTPAIGPLADSVMRKPSTRPRADPGACAARDAGRAARAHLQRRDLARTSRAAQRRAAGAAVRAPAVGNQIEVAGKRIEVITARTPCRACGSRSTAAAGAWVYTGDTGAGPGAVDLPAPCESRTGDRNGLQRRRSSRLHQPPPLPGRAGPRAMQPPGSVEVHITHMAGQTMRVKPDRCATYHHPQWYPSRRPGFRTAAALRARRAKT